jgi:Flp pilus assembly pilin Flp
MNTLEMMQGVVCWLQARFRIGERDEQGQSTMEWIIIVSLASIAAVGIVALVVTQLNNAAGNIKTK